MVSANVLFNTIACEQSQDAELSQSLIMFRILVQFGRLLMIAEHVQRARKSQDSGDVNMLGRWHDFAGEQGWAICDSPTVTDVQAWLFNWGSLISSEITPVQNDAEIRAMFQAKLG